MKFLLSLIFFLIPLSSGLCFADKGEWSGMASLDISLFPETPLWEEQKHIYPSLALQPEYYRSWDNGDQSFTLVPFVRLDAYDSERTHFDLRELTWLLVKDQWELRVGVRKLFWGVTESQHLVNSVNQSDRVEGLDGEEKLGQPMLNISYSGDLGTVDLISLPYFRERTFPGKNGRPRSPWPVDDTQSRFESPAKQYHMDWAARWYNTVGEWDLGFSHFLGTNRDPLFLPGTNESGENVLIPYYEQINQTGLDIQTTLEAWLLKGELISREVQKGRYTAFTGGFEYTLVGVFESDSDLGIISEYLFDDRGDYSTTPFENDLMIGLRLTLNDDKNSSFLLGTIVDLNSGSMAWSLESSRRVGESWKLSVEGSIFANIPEEDRLYHWRRDSFFRVEMARYF